MLRLSWTNLSGPVPSFLSQLPNLNFLDLSFNNLTGSIPPELSKLTNLGALHLDRYKLTGVIPESFGTFTGNVPDPYLSHNQLTGYVPISLGYLNFSRVDVSRNRLTGDFSMFFLEQTRLSK
ncbi:putative leucine-rich repeat domain superfamily [Helianthus annuus]|nr:putative leucine-rich repeat domain superfamily [Helianthus annuus]KAJ0883148.1 putative leucine-rich repeat domain superfamily [Helianthus annuus]